MRARLCHRILCLTYKVGKLPCYSYIKLICDGHTLHTKVSPVGDTTSRANARDSIMNWLEIIPEQLTVESQFHPMQTHVQEHQ